MLPDHNVINMRRQLTARPIGRSTTLHKLLIVLAVTRYQHNTTVTPTTLLALLTEAKTTAQWTLFSV